MSDTNEKPERTTLMLTNEINAWLDRQRAAMREKTGTCMSRSELLRSILRSTANVAEADFSGCRDESGIALVMWGYWRAARIVGNSPRGVA